MKVVINDPKAGQSFQRELEAGKASQLLGKKIGEQVEGSIVGLPGFGLQITGGSDADGTPMRFDAPASRKVRALLTRGPGVRHLRKGQRMKKAVVGNTISDRTAQVNAKIATYGSQPLAELGFVPKTKEEKAAAKPEEKAKPKAKGKAKG